MMIELKKFEDLWGVVLSNVERRGNGDGHDELIFTLENGDEYKLYHDQDCCEHVYIEDINGSLSDLVGDPILLAEESSNSVIGMTWTFYRLATVRGFVVIRWLGESNGYYSESVDWEKVEP
jgi:hypothetical protein